MLDPSKINIEYRSFTVENFINLRNENYLFFDKKECSYGKKSIFIESILIRVPFVLWINNSNYDKFEIIHGNNIVSSIFDYVDNKFSLSNMQFLPEYDGMTYENLPLNLQRRIRETSFICYTIAPGVPEEIVQQIISRINFI